MAKYKSGEEPEAGDIVECIKFCQASGYVTIAVGELNAVHGVGTSHVYFKKTNNFGLCPSSFRRVSRAHHPNRSNPQ